MTDRKKTDKFSKSIIDTQKDRQEQLKKAHQARKSKRRVETIYQRDILNGAKVVWQELKKLIRG